MGSPVMKFLLDQGLPRSAAAILRGRGFDVKHVGEVGTFTRRRFDLELAGSEDRVCCTLDADFHRHLAVRKMASPSVVRIRIERVKGLEAAWTFREINAI